MRFFGLLALGFVLVVPETPCSAQSDDGNPPESPNIVINILAEPPPASQQDALAAQQCAEEQDAARISGQIIVCGEANESQDYSNFNREDWERRYARRTQGSRAPNVEGLGGHPLYRALGSMFMMTVGVDIGKASKPPLIVDLEALPDASEGATANQTAKEGLTQVEEPR